MSGHTPGPWEAHHRPASPIEYGHHVTTADGLTVCNVTYQLPARVDGEVVEVARIANARLIAAAPDLLEANVKMVDMLNVAFHIESDSDDEVIYDQLPTSGVASVYFLARAAIRKATGAQP